MSDERLEKIAKHRKELTSLKGKVKRRRATAEELRQNIRDLERQITAKQDDIRFLGGKVKL